ncbi:putative zinc finger protein [Operophtera brumata]|uniref:Putative zinc finger protein n=1 Tax=Operophtera brumata TaxID=104452 RepID=A0A0L7KVR7_OPEBR|nr:putative zinc finger protein [Operophtera brumata]
MTRQKLGEHHNIHTGRAPYKCTFCDDTFRRYSNMKLGEHHNIHTGRAPYKCTFCDDTFRRNSNMVQHR